MKIYNGTAHAINIVEGATLDTSDRKYKGGNIIATTPSNGILNANIETVAGEPIGDIPVYNKKIVGYDPLPEGYDAYVVSALYSVAYKAVNPDDKRIYVVADPVMSDDGKTFIGCLGITLI